MFSRATSCFVFTFVAKTLLFFAYFANHSHAQSTEQWIDSLPAVAMDYKVHIEPGKEDCYYQYVTAGATFYVSYQVLRGGDGMAGFAVRNPAGELVQPYQWKPNGEYQDQQSTGGYYSVCIDNQFSKFADKLVNLYITVIRYDEWDRYAKEIEDMNMNMENFTSSITKVERNINEMVQYQQNKRARENMDYNLIMDNNEYVMIWSIIQIFVIFMTSAFQVYFVRSLFDSKSGSSSTFGSSLTSRLKI